MLKEKLEEKVIKFYEDELLGIKDQEGKLWLGVNKTCQNLGFNEADSKNQVTKINKDEVLSMNSLNFQTVQKEGNREVQRSALFISEKAVPLWLAKINVTDKMKIKYPKLSEKLIKYQLEVADVLHESFFETEEQKEKLFDELGLKGEIKDLRVKIETMDKTMGTLINSATINSYQAKQINKHARERVSTILGGAHSSNYKKNSRTYFKNLWLNLCDRFNVSEYRDLNPLNFADAVTYINGWSFS